MQSWDEQTPIYLQLREVVVRRIVEGGLQEGAAVPSVRQVASEEQINPLTVSRAYQMLVDEGLLEKRRGVGMFVCQGAQSTALETERNKFIEEEWPKILTRLSTLKLDLQLLPAQEEQGGGRT